jgi:hypothetical protein
LSLHPTKVFKLFRKVFVDDLGATLLLKIFVDDLCQANSRLQYFTGKAAAVVHPRDYDRAGILQAPR